MGILFVYEAKFKEDTEGNYYIDGSINEKLWSRYLKIDSKLSIISLLDSNKYEKEIAQAKFNSFNHSNKNFIQIPNLYSSVYNYLNPKLRYITNKTIEENLVENDFIVARVPCNASYQAVKHAKKHRKPYLIEVVGCPWDALWNHSLKGKLLAPLHYLSMRRCVKKAPYVLYVTNEFLQRRYPNKGKNIGCSDVELIDLNERILERRFEKIKNYTKDDPIILGTTAAVNVRYKGQQYVIKAISKLNKEGYNFEYHLVGGGDNSYLESIAKKFNVIDKVKFVGSIPHEEVFKYLDNIDIYIQPSETEGLPRALIEAMSRGCPSIGSNVGGIPELLNNGFTFRKGSVNDICDLLRKIDKNIMLEEARRSFEKAKEYDKDLLDKKREEFYKWYAEEAGKKND